ncbi:MFS transporter [Amycolatopsis alba]|uniref:MFS transporter n=1 Tax=Amycolatopsis alba DSM 44262 TaxID=1125972 RepID=A0A229RVB7_AMYAL|nr:MFS transporter [Amycolatopsis alba]OXM50475.1 MFS transporter [Amycolatopsis alba DSM 44262]
MPERPVRSRQLALVVLCLASLMVVLDGTIVVVALPSIQADLGFTPANLAWIVNAYLVPFGGLLLFSGRLGDLIGRRRVFLIGLSVFTVASLLCGMAGDQGMLIAFRCLQGIGGALTTSVVLGMIVTLFPGQPEQGKALGLFGFVQAGGASLGMILGGVLTQGLGWHWTMLVNVPIGIVVVLATFAIIERDSGAGLRAGVDVLGAVLVTAGAMLLVYVIVDTGAPVRRWSLLALAVLLLAGFVLRQQKAPIPLLPLGLFRSRPVTGGNIVMILMVAGMMGFQFLTALYLQQVLELDALTTGFAFLPTPVTNAVVALWLGPRLIGRLGTRPVLAGGLLVAAAGLALLTRVPADGDYFTDVLPPLLLAGIGMGAAVPAVIGTAMSAGSPEDSGVASGLVNTTLQIGSAVGTAVLAAVAASRTSSLGETVMGQREAAASGFRFAYLGSTAFVVLAVLAALVLIPAKKEFPSHA